MTGLGDEIVIRCPTCGYGLTARRYAVPKECPLCRGSFDAEATPAQISPASESEKENNVENKAENASAEEKREGFDEPGERRITLSIKQNVETGPLGLDTLRMPEAGSESSTPEPEEPAHEPAAKEEALNARAVVVPPQPQRARIEHATPAARARGSLEEKVAPEVVGRYADAYRAARTITFVGTLIKVLGVLLGLLIGAGLFALIATQGRVFGGTGAVGFLVGLILGGGTFAFFFVMGVVVSAQGQLIKATLDGAVNGSPFLSNAERAEAMSLR